MLKCLVTVWKTGKKLHVQLSILPATALSPYPTNRIPKGLKNYDKYDYRIYNWSFPGNINSHFQNEAKCENYLLCMSFICMRIETYIFLISIASHSTSLCKRGLSIWPMLYWSFGGEKLLFSHIKCCHGLNRYHLHGKKKPR